MKIGWPARRLARRAWQAGRLALLAVLAFAALAAWVRLGPLPEGLLEARQRVPSTVVVDRHGVVLYEARAADGTRGDRLDPRALPAALVQATIAAEDGRFYAHPGVDPIAVARAAWRNLRARRVTQGGSTITQQVVKLLLARRDGPGASRGLGAKLQEALLAVRLEHRLGKAQILALYLELAPYGNQFTGAERASRGYFGCAAASLTPAQAAFLAGLPQRPTSFNPYRTPQAALKRGREVLARMISLGYLPKERAGEAFAERLAFTRDQPAFLAPHFVEMVLSGLGDRRPSRVETTLDAGLQAEVEAIIRTQRAALDRYAAHNVAVVVLDNATGEWLAWEGSGDYFDAAHSGAIDGALALRQPGSALKPFTYALAFERGYTPATLLPDIPAHFPTAGDGVAYSPRNYDGRYRGPLRARIALAGSENIPAVAVASEIGVPTLLRGLKRVGLTSFDKTAAHYGLGLTLGNAEVRLSELAAAYAAFARGGLGVVPTALGRAASPRRPDSGALGEPALPVSQADLGAGDGERVFSPTTAFWITEILSDADAREYIFGRGGSLEFPFPVAVKTGTSQAYHDNWTIGYTRHVTVAVWVGNFDRAPLQSSSGVAGAGPIFHAVMLAAERRVGARTAEGLDLPIVPRPDGLVAQKICALSGMVATDACPSRLVEWLPADAGATCTWHHASDEGLIVVWPPMYRAWAAEHGMLMEGGRRGAEGGSESGTALPGGRRGTEGGAGLLDGGRKAEGGTGRPRRAVGPARLAIVNPPPDAVFLIDPTLRPEFQSLQLRARPARAASRIEWLVDGRSVGAVDGEKALAWPLSPGRHTVAARDETGQSDKLTILVK